jgi:outer membrane protein assembly factor BamB
VWRSVSSPAGHAAAVAVDWSYTTGSYVNSSPAVANGILYIDSIDEHLYAFSLADGPQTSPPTK